MIRARQSCSYLWIALVFCGDIRAAIKSSVLTYLNQCGHFPGLEQPEAFRRSMTEFFARTAN